MKNLNQCFLLLCLIGLIACNNAGKGTPDVPAKASETNESEDMGQAGVIDDDSQKDIVKIAISSADHSTLVAALKQAEYVNDLANAGPFTVFAPTNAAFGKLPPGTVDGLMKPDQKSALQNILEYHVAVGTYKQDFLNDGQTIGMANGDNVSIQIKDNKMMVNGKANVIATVQASNGIIHIIDEVLLPSAK
ncbi:MAG: fasciclin domain-containing protein [Saprospiraceae bacterium]|nr:fasciclin domain-containing protein [Saprospiraceae bacterium]MBK8450361.1 fasciclin domain-containing protein [Saprospiraceae bacterium]MBK8485559.1 fasciclin domain-containing protein [Saprospiraceae bacterium]MBK9222788.1 fasciclin domain-containing protein [Saprospiraceae bacterium]MBK9720172.1 fasciclin domain-containing protein [Saprospiraceae bacterium]